ncbi:ferric reductase-like transmembrane domain-containing protein [Microbulbifer epialgicus]|uniref:Ferric reductase-like transmembrane domain-containing protein n=1 Tax=Microbulbifer epialgicus TaxID=393907 RepID=A0ABV4NUR8_9GAMM
MKKHLIKPSVLVVLAATVSIPLVTWWSSVGNPQAYFTDNFPPGQILYIFSKLAGLVAVGLLGLQCLLALAKRLGGTGVLLSWSAKAHKVLGVLTFSLIVLHASLFFAAVSVRTEAPAWGLLLPKFTHGFYSQQVSLGLIALCLLCLGVFAGWKVASGSKRWRIGHSLWIVVLPLSFVHALSIGTESRFLPMLILILGISVLLLLAGLVRLKEPLTRKIKLTFGA